MTRIRTWIGLCLLLLGAAGCQPLEPPRDPIAWAWSYQAGDYIRSKPSVDGGVVYIGSDDNHLHAVDANTGEGVWTYETADNVTSAAATNDDGVYFASWDGGIYALDAAGESRWTVQADGWVSATPLFHDDLLYVGSQDGGFYALDADSGDLIWRFETNGRIDHRAAIAGDLVVFTASDGYVHALDLQTGQRRWFYYLDGTSNAPPVVAENQIYISSLNRSLTALDAKSGQARWIFTAEAPIGATPAVSDPVVYVAADDGMVFALDVESGQLLWQHATGEMIRSTPALWHGLLFVGTNSGNLYALDSTSGTLQWDYRLGGAMTQGPTISADRLYVGSTLSQLHAFDLSGDALSGLLPNPTASSEGDPAAMTQEAPSPFAELAHAMPAIIEYDRLWAAQSAMPDMDALQTVRDVIAFRPLSPAAYHAHVILARYYAEQEAPAAEDAYRSALALDDNVALRLELANYLETVGAHEAAYTEYRSLLSRQPDAFVGMRRTGADPLQVAADLNSVLFYTDALETFRDVDAVEAIPLRAEANMGLGRYAEAATDFRAHLRSHPDDEEARMGLALARAWLGNGEAALDLYSTVDTPESRRRQAQLLALEEPDLALDLYRNSPDPSAWWAATEMLESQARFTETLSIYEQIAQADTQYADDAAYRLYTLGKRLNNEEARAKGLNLLHRFGLNWLAQRSKDEPLQLEAAPAIALDHALAEKIVALESIGRHDLARLELLFAARFGSAPETDLAIAKALSERGDVREAQRIAERFINEHDSAPLDFWQLSYPRPYTETVSAAAAAYGVDPLLIWAVMREESRFDPDARSHADARGLMQVIPATQMWIAEAMGEAQAPGDAYVPATSIHMAAWLLDFLSDYFDGDMELAIPAYNAGAGSVDSWLADSRVEDRDDLLRWIGYNETRLYLKRVALSHQIYRSLYETE